MSKSPDAQGGIAALLKRLADAERALANANNKVPDGYLYDTNNVAVFAPDPLGGLSQPWLAVPLLCLFDDSFVQTEFFVRIYNEVYQGVSLSNAEILTDQLVYTGVIPQIIHPMMEVVGIFGPDTNSDQLTVTVQFNGNTVATVAPDPNVIVVPQSQAARYGPFNITPFLYQQGVQVQVFARSTESSGLNGMVCAIQCLNFRGSI